MKVHSSLQSSYTSAFQTQSNSSSDDDTPFTLPGDVTDQQQQQQASTSSASVASAGFSASLSSFWINQADDPTSTSGNGSSDGQSSQSIEDEFGDLASMSPADKIRAQYLQQQGLTEDQFNQLPSDQQQTINDAIAAQIKQQLGDPSQTGQDSDDATASATAAVSLG